MDVPTSTGTASTTTCDFRTGRERGRPAQGGTQAAGKTGTTHPLEAGPARCSPTSMCPPTYFLDMIKRQAVVNAGLTFVFLDRRDAAPRRPIPSSATRTALRTTWRSWPGWTALTPVQCLRSPNASGPGPGGPAGVQGEDERGLLLFQQAPAAGILPQLQLAGARRQPGQGGASSAFVCQIDAYLKQHGPVQEEREQNQLRRTCRTA